MANNSSELGKLIVSRRIGETLSLKIDQKIIARIIPCKNSGLVGLNVLLTEEYPGQISVQDNVYTISNNQEFVASAQIVRFTSGQVRCLIKAAGEIKIQRLESICPKCGEIVIKFPPPAKQKRVLLMSCMNCQSTYLVDPYDCKHPVQLDITFKSLLKKYGIPTDITDRQQIQISLKATTTDKPVKLEVMIK